MKAKDKRVIALLNAVLTADTSWLRTARRRGSTSTGWRPNSS